MRIARYVADDGDLDLLWLGKFSLSDLPLIEDLDRRGVLRSPRVLPRFLQDPATADNLARAAGTHKKGVGPARRKASAASATCAPLAERQRATRRSSTRSRRRGMP